MSQAWVVYDNFFTSSAITFANEPAGIDSQWRQLTQRNTYSHKVWNDAYLAAFAICAGLEVVTFDQGFTQFPNLKYTILT
jgi:predicted nucleic acid-binding protein